MVFEEPEDIGVVGSGKRRDMTGAVLGHFTLLEKIGEGSLGVVYRGFQANLKRPVAVKLVFREKFNKLFTAERFRQEAELVANIDHPGIITLFEFGEEPDFLYYVMQLIDGVNLGQWLRTRKKHPVPGRRLPEVRELVSIARQTLEVLAHAHSEGVVHRDIKPENLMWLEKQKRLMVADFGLAWVYHTVYKEEKNYVLGSPLYVSPEQARGEDVDGRADIFSLGCVLLELTVGFLPVRVERPEKVFQTRAKEDAGMFTGMAIDHRPGISQAWSDLIAKALAPSREDRFSDAEAMLRALEAIVPG